MITRMHVCAFWAFVCFPAYSAQDHRPSNQLVQALIRVESAGKDDAIGDLKLKDHAYGPLQIRQPVCDEVNKHYCTSYRAEQCLGNRRLSLEIFSRYMEVYATKKAIGHNPTDEDRARIWNGGPKGYKRSCTDRYWKRVQQTGLLRVAKQ